MPDKSSFPAQGSNRRTEFRYPTDDLVELIVAPNFKQRIAARILNVSRCGLQLEIPAALLTGSHVEVFTSPKLVVLGEVRWCQRVGEVYHAGLPIEGIIVGEQEESVHLDDDRLALYLSGRGLTTPEVLAVQKHLDECVECRTRLSDTAEML